MGGSIVFVCVRVCVFVLTKGHHKSNPKLKQNLLTLVLLARMLGPFCHVLATLAPPLAPKCDPGAQDRKRAENVASLVTPGVPPGGTFLHIFRHFVHFEAVF